MEHEKTGLFTPFEHRDFYSIPILDDHERHHYFTLTENEFESLSFTYANNTLNYRHGPTQRKKFTWPQMNSDLNTCEISSIDFNQQENSITFKGNWSIFRFIDQCEQKTTPKKGNILLTLPLKTNAQFVFISSHLIPFLQQIGKLRLPTSLIKKD